MYREDYEEEQDHANNVDGQYFSSYGTDLQVTRTMLEDTQRMKFFDHLLSTEMVCDKIILDVGAGSGILSMFAAKNGARKVIALEASVMAKTAEKIIRDNGFSNVIHFVHMLAEDVTLDTLRTLGVLRPNEKIDIVVSEWMGFYLFHECMLNSVLKAKAVLAPDALLLPSHGELWMAPITLEPIQNQKYQLWKDKVYGGFNFDVLAHQEWDALSSQNPLIISVPSSCVLCEPQRINSFDFSQPQSYEELDMSAVFHFGSSARAKELLKKKMNGYSVQGFVIYFTVMGPSEDFMLNTAPDQPETHWKQTVIVLPEAVCLNELVTEGTSMGVKTHWVIDAESRTYDMDLELCDPEEIEGFEECK